MAAWLAWLAAKATSLSQPPKAPGYSLILPLAIELYADHVRLAGAIAGHSGAPAGPGERLASLLAHDDGNGMGKVYADQVGGAVWRRLFHGGIPLHRKLLLRGLVDPRLIRLSPGAGDHDPGLLGEGADEAPDGVLFMPMSA